MIKTNIGGGKNKPANAASRLVHQLLGRLGPLTIPKLNKPLLTSQTIGRSTSARSGFVAGRIFFHGQALISWQSQHFRTVRRSTLARQQA